MQGQKIERKARFYGLVWNINKPTIPQNVLKEWVKLITDELSQISKIKRSDKARA